MIGNTPGLGNIQSESLVRHKVRKLRAKVRSLIPIDICGKYQKRNHRINKLNQFQQTWHQNHNTNKQQWKPTTGFNSASHFHNPHLIQTVASSLYQQTITQHAQPLLKRTNKLQKTFNNALISQNPKDILMASSMKIEKSGNQHNLQRYEFEKLTLDEIEQINEDKIYYLGQEHIQAYNKFLKSYQHHLISSTLKNRFKPSNSTHLIETSVSPSANIQYNSTFTSSNKVQKYWKSESNIRKTSLTVQDRHRKSLQVVKGEQRTSQKQLKDIKQMTLTEYEAKTLNKRRNFKSLEERKQYLQGELKNETDYLKSRQKNRQEKNQFNCRQLSYQKYSKFKKSSIDYQKKAERALLKKQTVEKNNGEIAEINQILRKKIILKKTHKQSNKPLLKESIVNLS